MKRKKALQVAAGCVLILASIWGGPIMLHYLPEWLGFAGFSTAMLTFLSGTGVVIHAFVEDL